MESPIRPTHSVDKGPLYVLNRFSFWTLWKPILDSPFILNLQNDKQRVGILSRDTASAFVPVFVS